MSKNSDKIQPGWLIPKTVKESFDEFCVEFGLVAQEDCAGALTLWTQMPAQIREWAKLEAKGKGDSRIDKAFWVRLQTVIQGSIPMLLETSESQMQSTEKPSKTG